jgi:indole-3-glycerol phosphate synthase
MNDMILKIISANKTDLKERKQKIPIEGLVDKLAQVPKTRNFSKAFDNFGVIAEIKIASPSAGDLEEKENIGTIVAEYREGGADALSVVTEKYFFKGDLSFIKIVKEIARLPVLQKDFIVDPYQIYESRVCGADALLLIVKLLSPEKLREYVNICFKLGLEPVVEVNDKSDLSHALVSGAKIIAVNARDLNTFNVDVARACGLLKEIPDEFLKLGFSGIVSSQESAKYKSVGARGVLIGTNLIKSVDKREFLKEVKNAN